MAIKSLFVCNNCGREPFQNSPLLPNERQIAEVHQFSRSNTFPLETSNFLRVIGESPPELARYDSEIERLTKLRDQLVLERARLESYVDGCRHIFSPVRRLPPELLAEIFHLCAPPSADDFTETDTEAHEMDRLSQRHLLELSQVCFHWHAICMTTPKLWSILVVDTGLWDECTVPQEALLARLASSLQRSGNHPLTLAIGGHDDVDRHPAFDLLVEHSERWRDVYLCCRLDSFNFHDRAEEKFPLLERFNILDSAPAGINRSIFRAAPRLTEVFFNGAISRLLEFPWSQIRYFNYSAGGERDLSCQLSLLPRLPIDSQFYWCLTPADIDIPLNIIPTVSDVAILSIEPIIHYGDEEHGKEILGAVFDALTVPRLVALELQRPFLEPGPFWDHARFLSFATRSSFRDHLTELQLHTLMTDEELLQCLGELPLLKVLTVSDGDGTDDHVVVTNQLLNRLTWIPDAQICLTPHLHYFNCTSRFKFSPDAYRDFLTSRLVSGRTHDIAPSNCKGTIWEFLYPPSSEPFQLRLWWLPSSEQQLPPEDFTDVLAQVVQLARRGELGFRSGLHPDAPSQSHVAIGDALVG